MSMHRRSRGDRPHPPRTGSPDAAWTTWDLDRRSRERASRLPPFTHALRLPPRALREHLLSEFRKLPWRAAVRSTDYPLLPPGVLPLSSLAGHLPPLWLSPHLAMRRAG